MNSSRRRSHALAAGLWFASAILGGCAHASGFGGSSGTLDESLALGAPADHYDSAAPRGVGVAGALGAAATATIERVAHEHAQTLLPDPRLLQLSRWLRDHLAPDGSLPTPREVDDAARLLGLIEPTPHFVVIAAQDAATVEQRFSVQTEALFAEHDYSHYGVVTDERGGGELLIATFGWRFIELHTVPRSIAQGQPIALEGQLTHAQSRPQLAVTLPDGLVTRSSAGDGTSFSLHVPTPKSGVYRVEILAESKLGTTVVANFPIYVGIQAPAHVALSTESDSSEQLAHPAQALLELLNAERKKLELPALAFDERLAEIAHAHDQDMLAHGFVGHTSPTTGSSADRVARAGVRTSLVLENIGRGYSLREIHDGLLSSPGHRANMLNALATHVGIDVTGTPDGARTVYLATQVFIRITPDLPSHAGTQLFEAINQARKQHDLPALTQDVALGKVAMKAASSYFERPSASDAELMQAVPAQLPRSKTPREVGALLAIAGSLEELAALPAVLDPKSRSVGIGLAQGQRPDSFPNSICAVLLLAR